MTAGVSLLLATALGGFFSPTVNAENASLILQSALFSKALGAARQGRLGDFREGLAFFKDYPLRDYLTTAQLRHELNTSADNELDSRIRRFVARHPDLPPARRLARRWFISLGKRSRWSLLLSQVDKPATTRIRCAVVHAQIATGKRPVNAALALYHVGKSQPDSCDPVFAWLDARGLLTAKRVKARARLAIESNHTGLARYLAGRLQPKTAARKHIERWIAAAEHPRSLADRSRLDGEIAVHVFKTWALSDPVAAASALPGIVDRLGVSSDQRYQMRRYIALLFAEEHRPAALAWYARIDNKRMADDEHALGWYIRAALYQQRWSLALKRIRALPVRFAKSDEWQYWRARALDRLGENDTARRVYEAIAGHRSYYGFMAADRIGARYHFNAKAVPDNRPARRALAHRPGIVRARLLYQLDMRHAATREWRLATSDLGASKLAQAAALAHQWGWFSRAIITLARADVWSDLAIRYPLPFQARVDNVARGNGLDPALVYGVMRTESLFRPAIRSHAGATGIMQLTPATARYVGRRLDPPQPSEPLTDPAVSIALGGRLLRHLDTRWQGQRALTIASYNAGKGKVSQWLPKAPMPADIWIANISYTETRRYVERVFKHATVFAHRMGEPVTRLADRMSPIKPNYPKPPTNS